MPAEKENTFEYSNKPEETISRQEQWLHGWNVGIGCWFQATSGTNIGCKSTCNADVVYPTHKAAAKQIVQFS